MGAAAILLLLHVLEALAGQHVGVAILMRRARHEAVETVLAVVVHVVYEQLAVRLVIVLVALTLLALRLLAVLVVQLLLVRVVRVVVGERFDAIAAAQATRRDTLESKQKTTE